MDIQQEAQFMLGLGVEAVERLHQADATGGGVTKLPKECNREDMQRLGFTFGEILDDLFVAVTSPAGWEMRHRESYHSYLFDDQGRERGYMFFKGVFYDRAARIRLTPRYYVAFDSEPEPPKIREKRWCRTYKESGYDRVAEVMPRDWTPPRQERSRQVMLNGYGDAYYHDYKSGRSGRVEESSYKFMMVDCYEVEPPPYKDRKHRYLVKDRADDTVLFEGEWMFNGDYSDEAKAKQDAVHDWMKKNFPECGDVHAYW